MHCVTIDVPLLEHIHRGGQDNVDQRGALRIHVAMSDSALYTYIAFKSIYIEFLQVNMGRDPFEKVYRSIFFSGRLIF